MPQLVKLRLADNRKRQNLQRQASLTTRRRKKKRRMLTLKATPMTLTTLKLTLTPTETLQMAITRVTNSLLNMAWVEVFHGVVQVLHKVVQVREGNVV